VGAGLTFMYTKDSDAPPGMLLGGAYPSLERTVLLDWITVGPPASTVDLPQTEAKLKKAGWTKQSEDCDPQLGLQWTQTGAKADRDKPLSLWTTAGGQVSGISVDVYGAIQPKLTRYYVSKNGYSRLDVAIRKGDIICNGKTEPGLGTTLIINPTGEGEAKVEVGLTEDWPIANGWTPGSCVPGMGRHYLLDIESANGTNTYKTSGQFPVIIMYHEGVIDGFFFQAPSPQNPGWKEWNLTSTPPRPPSHPTQWDMEGATIRRFLCGNTCDNCATKGEVGWDGTSYESMFWSSLHIFLKDPQKMKECPAEFGCIENPLSRMDPPMKAICCPDFPPWNGGNPVAENSTIAGQEQK